MAERFDDVTSGSVRGRSGRKVMPLLPAQQSPAERVASNKNKILQRRLQFQLASLNKDRRAWEFQRHKEVSRYQQRAEHFLHLLTPHPALSDLPPTNGFPCRGLSSATDVNPLPGKSKRQRPATSSSLQFWVSGFRPGPPQTPAQVRPKTTGAWSGLRKPMLPACPLKTSLSTEDNADSDDSPTTEDSDSEDYSSGAVKTVSSFPEKAPSPDTSLSNTHTHTGKFPLRKTKKSFRSALIQTPKKFQGPHIVGVSMGRPQTDPQSRGGGPEQVVGHNQKQDQGKHSSSVAPSSGQQVQTLGIFWDRKAPSSTGVDGRGLGGRGIGNGGVRRGGSSRANYINYVLNMERDKYELSQMKVRDYLNSLTI